MFCQPPKLLLGTVGEKCFDNPKLDWAFVEKPTLGKRILMERRVHPYLTIYDLVDKFYFVAIQSYRNLILMYYISIVYKLNTLI